MTGVMVRPVLRSVLPAVAILALMAWVAVVAEGRADRPPAPGPWSAPQGYDRMGVVETADGVLHELWLNGGCWYLASRSPDGEGAWGACGGVPGEPWIVYDGGVVAGQLRAAASVPAAPLDWVSVNGGDPLALADGAFLAVAEHPGRVATLEFLDSRGQTVNRFPDVRVGGQAP